MALSDIEKWQDAFVNYSVPEIFQLNTQLRTHVTAKKQELRDLVGNRYRDMLKTADIIMEMNDVVGKEDESLSELCTSHRYSAWATHGQNVKMFRKSSGRVDAVEGLLVRIVSFVKRHGRAIRKSQNYVLVARSIWLARVLLDQLNGDTTSLNIRKQQQLKADVDHVESVFSKAIEDLLLKGEETESIISYNNLFLAYCILNKVSAEQALQSMLTVRLDDAKGVDYANILIHSLSSFASGSVGDIKPISDEYKTWVKSVSTIQSHVEEVSKMKALLSGKYPSLSSDDSDIGKKRTSTTDSVDDDDEDDYESAEFWRRTEKKLISTNHSVFSQHITKSLTNVHSELLTKITTLAETNIDNKVSAFVLLIRAVLLLDAHFRKLGTAQDAVAVESLLVSVYERLGDSIAKDLDAIDIDLYKSEEEERGPSLYISDYLTKLVKHLTNVLGDDELLWSNAKLTGLLRERVGHGIIEELKRVDKSLRANKGQDVNLQVAADTVVTEPKLDAAEESPVESAQPESEKQQDENSNENAAEPVNSDVTTTKEPVSESELSESTDEKSPIKKESIAEGNPPAPLLTDYKYVSLLLGVTDPYFDETNDKSLVEIVKRTRILYLPLVL
ncbi:hypothetical protein D0Z00_000581 [Geotrichum galactomycetum]|uniref:Uncharacterized protein n=1 Tax=Geotrichum galactomycetum TaxID=27317 RepID=A0ACB6V9E1_9ASCO|nr:hypothetical protein D0Z00_000581 [Geotrichum candidum]